MLKKVSLYSLISGINALIGLLVVMFMTHVLPPEEYAMLGIYASIVFFLSPALSFNSLPLVSINTVDEEEDYPAFANRLINFILFMSFFALAVGGLMIWVGTWGGEYLKLLTYTVGITLLNVLIQVHYLELIYKSKAKLFGVYKISLALLGALTTVGFVSLSPTWEARLNSLMLAGAITLCLAIGISFQSLRQFKFSWRFKINDLISFGAPLMIGLGAAWINTQADKYIVLNYFNQKTLGFYSFGASLGTAFIMVNQSAVNAVAPKVFGDLKYLQARSSIKRYFYFSTGFILLIILLAETVLELFGHIIFGKEYLEAIPVAQLIILSMFFNGAYRAYGLVLDYFKENAKKTIIAYIVAGVNIITSLSLIPVIGIYAPVIGTILSWVLNFFLYFVFAQKVLRERGVN